MFIIKMAGLMIRIDNKYNYVEKQCLGYLSSRTEAASGECDFSVTASLKEILKERNKSGSLYSCGYCESICLYRKICIKMLDYQGFLLHASVVEVDGQAYAFAARSGTGKSTHTALWMEYFSPGACMINGDKPILRYVDEQLMAYGTPWCGKEGLHTNTSAPVTAICFIERSKKNEIRKIEDNEIIDRIFHQVLLPEYAEGMNRFLGMLDEVCRTVPCYVLKCNISNEADITAYRGITQSLMQ